MTRLLAYLIFWHFVCSVSTVGFSLHGITWAKMPKQQRSVRGECTEVFNPLVALTRESSKNEKLRVALNSKGIETIDLPCISHDIGEDRNMFTRHLLNSHTWTYIVITSPQAASVLLEAWREIRSPSIRTASVGSQTSSVLIQGGITPVFESSCANADTLAVELPFSTDTLAVNNKVLYPASARASDKLQTKLSERGFEVTRLNTYTTEAAQWDAGMIDKARGADIATFGSPSAVKV